MSNFVDNHQMLAALAASSETIRLALAAIAGGDVQFDLSIGLPSASGSESTVAENGVPQAESAGDQPAADDANSGDADSGNTSSGDASSGDESSAPQAAVTSPIQPSTSGIVVLIECSDGGHWLFVCPRSNSLPVHSTTTSQLQALVDALREAICSTLNVRATHVVSSKDLRETLRRAGTPDEAHAISVRLSDDAICQMYGPSPSAVSILPARTVRPIKPYHSLEEGLEQLPPYTKSLLQVHVPISVTLASTKKPVSAIVGLGPGAIIQFKKSCDETLSLEVAGLPVAEGEAVKVGEKFGLWITEIKLPAERFKSLKELI